VISLTRRSRTAPIASTPVITVGRLEIDIVARTVRAGGSELHLTPLDLGLLYSLAATLAECSRARRSLTRSGGRTNGAESTVVDQHVRNLQTDGRQPRCIATVAGRGYRFLPSGQTGLCDLAARPTYPRSARIHHQVTPF
jgi:two-component system KDP operon response regulator KdpE